MNLDQLRAQIDLLDEKILSLLSERGRLAASIGKVKQKDNAAQFVPSREKQILERMTSSNPGPLSAESVAAVYEQIIAACRVLEIPLGIAYLGPPGTFCHLAAKRKFGPDAAMLPFSNIDDVFMTVEKREASFGMVPVENSIAGVERTTLDRFVGSTVHICAECYVDIQHNLLSKGTREEIKRVYSHPQALHQCRNWLRTNLPEAETIEVSSTARAAQMAAAEAGSAAIGTELAASLYDLPILTAEIQDRPDNRTRFLVIGQEDAQPSGKDKTSLMFAVKHRAGSLWEALGVLHRYKINMTMIESRPTQETPWEYVFFADVQGHSREEPLPEALEALAGQTLFVRVLGSYPEAE
ncbi:MAG: prephenate dehydratase [Armatimonadetes bacterium]|nr:prephenate dehydratase [Armatimonadota bacterium]NIM24637.1 prephenate dehydratase [Armatimonadota bacterium]NIM68516.1 prephenate dehydratase [Armatimonadota bacterium]NIM76898.1 prephenate dehydratase [Armatimonadota bacterium]NIN06710.1 prephenate dehydratase [Armatimonadota bacterium]